MSLLGTEIEAIAIDPANKNNMFAGTACTGSTMIGGELTCSTASGLYRSTNAGDSWTQVNDTNLKKGVNSIAIAPDNSTNRKMFVSIEGRGVYKSVDGGVSWVATPIHPEGNLGVTLTKQITQIIVTNKIGTQQAIYALVRSSAEYAGAAGIYASVNDGLSWSQIYVGDDIRKLVVSPSQPKILYVSTTLGEMRKATNVNPASSFANVSFTSVTSGLPSVVVDFMMDPTNSDYLYASAFGGGVTGFYRSTNGGASWLSQSSELFQKVAIDKSQTQTKFYGAKNVNVGSQTTVHVFSSTNGISWVQTDNTHTGFISEMKSLVANNGALYSGVAAGLYKNVAIDPGNNNSTNINVKMTVQATSTAVAGGDITYTMTLTNPSTSVDVSAFTITSSKLLPAGTLKITNSPLNSCTVSSNGAVSCNVSQLNRSTAQTASTRSIELKVRLPSALTTTQVQMSFTANVLNDTNSLNNSNIVANTTISSSGSSTIPVVTSDRRSVVAGSAIGSYTFTASSNSSGTLTYIIVSGGEGLSSSLGTVKFVTPKTGNTKESFSGAFTYQPKLNVVGRDTIRFKVRDSNGKESSLGSFDFDITSASNSGGTGTPLVTSDRRSVAAGSVVGSYSFNATPANSTDQLTYVILSGGEGTTGSLGTVLFVSPSATNVKESRSPSFTYRPNANVVGQDSIRFQVRDSTGKVSNTGIFTFDITGPSTSEVVDSDAAGSGGGGAIQSFIIFLFGLMFAARRFKPITLFKML